VLFGTECGSQPPPLLGLELVQDLNIPAVQITGKQGYPALDFSVILQTIIRCQIHRVQHKILLTHDACNFLGELIADHIHIGAVVVVVLAELLIGRKQILPYQRSGVRTAPGR